MANSSDQVALITRILSNTDSSNQDSLSFRFFEHNQKTMRNLTEEPASFMWFQLLVDVLQRIPIDQSANEEMIRACKEHCHGNEIRLQILKGFGDSGPSDAIKWYTKDSFLYRLLNEALRTEDTDMLHLFRKFIIDLHSQIKQKQRQHSFSTPNMKVYRGQAMFKSELERLLNSIGHLVSVNSFFSASLMEDVAEIFSGSDQSDTQKVSVFFRIDVDLGLQHTLFACLDNLSEYPSEDEVLFSLSSVFEVMNVSEERDKHRWCVDLRATDEGYEILEKYRQFMALDAETPTIEIVFGRLLMYMGQYEKAARYFVSLDTRINYSQMVERVAILSNQANCVTIICANIKKHIGA